MTQRSFMWLAWRCALALLLLGGVPLFAQDDLRLREEQALKKAAEAVAPSVVRIETVGGLDRVGELLVGTAPTTGLIVSADGYIVSSAFSFAQKPDSILVTLAGGTRLGAKLVATDLSRMLVLLKVDAPEPLPVPRAVSQSDVRVGQWAIALGRTFEGSAPSVSVGIVSAVGRIWGKAIQTDAKVSPNNYGGPLVDASGGVLGVLVPLSIEGGSELAGVEWYDSGIGFAVPLTHIQKILPRLKQGINLKPGIMGISLSSNDWFSDPPVVAAVRAGSPAFKAGLRAKDTIIEAAGQKIVRQAQLKQELNHLYAGDTIHIALLRGKQRIETQVELIDKLAPYEFPFLGILPLRGAAGQPERLMVRYVYPGSPAAQAGVRAGDRVVSLQGKPTPSATRLAEELRLVLPDDKVRLEIARGDKTMRLELRAGRLPEAIPKALPAAHEPLGPPPAQRPQVGVISLKLPEFQNECVAYVPDNYDPRLASGLVIWLHSPGSFDQKQLVERWQTLCRDHDLILLAPKAADPAKWLPGEARFVRRALDELKKTYRVDPARIVVHGHEGGGRMAYVVGFSNADVVRGIAAVEAPLPARAPLPETDPLRRLALLLAGSEKTSVGEEIQDSAGRLRELKYPVSVMELGAQARYLSADELANLVRWIDSLDRL